MLSKTEITHYANALHAINNTSFHFLECHKWDSLQKCFTKICDFHSFWQKIKIYYIVLTDSLLPIQSETTQRPNLFRLSTASQTVYPNRQSVTWSHSNKHFSKRKQIKMKFTPEKTWWDIKADPLTTSNNNNNNQAHDSFKVLNNSVKWAS